MRAHVARARTERALRSKLQFAETHATIDALTGLFNRRHFEARLREEVSHVRRHSRPLAMVLLDLDHFKAINDTFGHEDGDRVLSHVAGAIRAVLRAEDAAFRYGGEEFVILLRDCEVESAAVVAERLRAHLAGHPIELGAGKEARVVTFSGGIACAHARNAFNVSDMVARADQALYRAKRGGRDRMEREGSG